METIEGLPCDSILANPNRLLRGKPLATAFPAIVDAAATLRRRTAIAAPREIEGVSFRAALRILNSNDGGPSVLRPANQFLAAAPVHAYEPEVWGIARYATTSALEATPLRRLAGQIPKDCITSANLHLGRPINDNFDGAFSTVGTTARGDAGFPWNCLAASGPANRGKRAREDNEKTPILICLYIHFSPFALL